MKLRRATLWAGAVAGILWAWPRVASAQTYPEVGGWYFQNFNTPSLPWDVFRDTFIGIPPTRDPVASGFDVLFYDQVYETSLSKDGNCFGMSVMSLLIAQQGGYLGYCDPVSQYSGDFVANPGAGPTNLGLRRAINIVHGYQVNLPTLEFMLDVIAQHKNRDGAYAFDQFQFYRMKNDPTIISITKGLNPMDGGHTLVAYDAQDLGGGNKKIFVYDPNRTWKDPSATERGWYQGGNNYISISGHSWSFTMGSGETWSGDPGSGGNIVITPLSVTGVHARSPSSLGTEIIGKVLNVLLLSGSTASVEQMTDASGKRLYKPGTYEVDTDPATGMLSVLPWSLSDGTTNKPSGMLYYVLGNTGGALNVQLRSGSEGYSLRVAGARSHVQIDSQAGDGAEVVALKNPGTEEPSVMLDNRRNGKSYQVTFTQVTQPGRETREISVSGLQVPSEQPVELSVVNGQAGLMASSSGAPVQYGLRFRSLTRAGEQVKEEAVQKLEAGESRLAMPGDWKGLAKSQTLGMPVLKRTGLVMPAVQERTVVTQ